MAEISGDHRAYVVDGDNFTSLTIELSEPIPISRNELVATNDAVEEMDAIVYKSPRPNKAQDRANSLIIGSLVRMAFNAQADKPYQIARKVCAEIELVGENVSLETVAKKVEDGLRTVPRMRQRA